MSAAKHTPSLAEMREQLIKLDRQRAATLAVGNKPNFIDAARRRLIAAIAKATGVAA